MTTLLTRMSRNPGRNLSLPIISLQRLAESGSISSQGLSEHEKLFVACSDYGFFYLSDHGIPKTFINETIKATKKFFALPQEVKNRYHQSKQVVWPKNSRGYSPLFGEILHSDEGPDPKEIFDFGPPKPLSSQPFTGPNIAPDDLTAPNFTKTHLKLQTQILDSVLPQLVRGLARALNWDAESFAKYFEDPIVIHRSIYYPPNFGFAGKHTDGGILTILIQEELESPSLRIFTKNAWIDAECKEDLFVVNLGDMLQTWTGGTFISTPHQVVHKMDYDRVSIPFFVHPTLGSEIRPCGSNEILDATQLSLSYFQKMGFGEGAGRAKELT